MLWTLSNFRGSKNCVSVDIGSPLANRKYKTCKWPRTLWIQAHRNTRTYYNNAFVVDTVKLNSHISVNT